MVRCSILLVIGYLLKAEKSKEKKQNQTIEVTVMTQ